MKKKGLLSLLFPLIITSLAGCFNPEKSLTSEEMERLDNLLVKENDNSASNNRDRFDKTFPNTYEPSMAYTYEDYYNHNYYTIDSTPSNGNIDFLIIPVRLRGYNLKNEDKIRQDIYDSYFGDGLDFESVSSYFKKSSYNNLSIGGYVTEWYNTNYDYTIDQDGTESLVVEAIDWAKQYYKNIIDFKSLDKNNDGFLDAVCLIYNTPNSYRGNTDNLWAYSSWVYNIRGDKNDPKPRCFFWASYDFMYENTKHSELDAHTYIHETGHLIGLDDYYDYAKNGYAGASGGAIMQSHNVGDHDPYSKLALGWINPLVVNGESEITLKPFSTSGQILILTNRDNFNSPFDEYIIIDFYKNDNLNYYDSVHQFGGTGSGMPLLPDTYGIRMWHVDARLARYDARRENYTIEHEVKGGYNYHLNSNSSSGPYASLDSANRNYRLLHLFQRGLSNTFEKNKNTFFSAQDMFKEGDLFSLQRYGVLTVNKGKFNDGSSLNYSLEITSLNENEAKLKVEVI